MDSAARIAARPSGQRERRLLLLVSYALTASAAAVTAVAVAASGAPNNPGLVGLARGLIVATPIAVGLYAWQRPSTERFGLLLIGAGAACFVTTLAESRHDVLYTVGRTAGWLLEVLVVYLVLAFPTGRLSERVDRVLVGAMGAAAVVFFFPRLALANDFEVPSPFTSCLHHCPPNAFFALDREPAFVDSMLRPLGAAMVFAVMIGVGFRLWQNGREASRLTRRALADALADPALEIAFPSGDGDGAWMDGRGLPLTLPQPGSGRSVSEVRTGGDQIAAIVHDEALSTNRELVDAATGMAALLLDNHRLAAEATKSLREVRRSRARIATSAERERRRIERDLHDGAQQR